MSATPCPFKKQAEAGGGACRCDACIAERTGRPESPPPLMAVLSLYSSRPDIYGNSYHAVSLTRRWHAPETATLNGTIAAPNIDTRDCREVLGWHVEQHDAVPIREFNRMVKGWPHLGCTWPEIKSKLQGKP